MLFAVTHLHAGELLEHLDDCRAVFLVEPLGAAHLVDLLRQIGEKERHAKALGERGFEFLVLARQLSVSRILASSWSLYEMSIVPPGAKSRRSIRGTRFSNCTELPVLARITS